MTDKNRVITLKNRKAELEKKIKQAKIQAQCYGVEFYSINDLTAELVQVTSQLTQEFNRASLDAQNLPNPHDQFAVRAFMSQRGF